VSACSRVSRFLLCLLLCCLACFSALLELGRRHLPGPHFPGPTSCLSFLRAWFADAHAALWAQAAAPGSPAGNVSVRVLLHVCMS
jgi:hypothetical protein